MNQQWMENVIPNFFSVLPRSKRRVYASHRAEFNAMLSKTHICNKHDWYDLISLYACCNFDVMCDHARR